MIPALAYECQLSSIHLASYSGSDHVVRALLNQAGVEVGDKSSPSEFTPLHLACLTGHVGVVGLLISRSTDLLKATDSNGRTPLHLAADNGHFEMCQVLLGQGSLAAVEDLELWTSLHCAARAGHLNVVVLLTGQGSPTTAKTLEGRTSLWYACIGQHMPCVEFLLRQPHDTEELLADEKFVYNLMKLSKGDNWRAVEEFLILAPAPVDTGAKLSAIYRQLAETEKERSLDLLEAADFCEELTRQMVITCSHIDSPSALLNATDASDTQFIDVLIENNQKKVIAEYVVQQYLQEVMDGGLKWSTVHWVAWLLLFLVLPPVWFAFSVPIDLKMNKIPVVKYLARLTGHFYFMLFLCLNAVICPHSTARTSLLPYWYEVVLFTWYAGNALDYISNPGAKGGLALFKPIIVVLGVIAFIVHLSAFALPTDYYWSLLMYVRDQFFGLTLLCCSVLLLDYLALHHVFGPWNIIIGECLLDVAKFMVVLLIFMLGFALLGATMNRPFGFPDEDYVSEDPEKRGQRQLFEEVQQEEWNTLLKMLEVHFYALFNAGHKDIQISEHVQPWTDTYFMLVHFAWLILSVIVLINLLIAMMSDTYCRIQEQSDIEWKFGRAKLIRNVQRTNVAPAPLNLLTTWLVTFRKKYLDIKVDRYRAKMKFRRAMKEEIMQKAPGMKFVVEEQEVKKKKRPRVIQALGNMKWGFAPQQKGVLSIDQLQTRWDREHHMKSLQEHTFGGSNLSLDEFRSLSKSVSWAAVVRNYLESHNRGNELKAVVADEATRSVSEMMKSRTNMRLEQAKKEQAQRWGGMPNQTKTKVQSSFLDSVIIVMVMFLMQ